MAGEWVGPVVTGLVGVAGIVGTYWTGREGRQAASAEAVESRRVAADLQQRSEKREAYFAMLEALREAEQFLPELQRHRFPLDSQIGDKLRVTLYRLEHATQPLRIMAPPSVSRAAAEAAEGAVDRLNDAVEVGNVFTLDETLLDNLLDAMRQDLGYPPARSIRTDELT